MRPLITIMCDVGAQTAYVLPFFSSPPGRIPLLVYERRRWVERVEDVGKLSGFRAKRLPASSSLYHRAWGVPRESVPQVLRALAKAGGPARSGGVSCTPRRARSR